MPIYQTAAHLSDEATVAERVAKTWGLEQRRRAVATDEVDRDLLHEGVVVATFEVKCRKNPSTAYGGVYAVDKRKIEALLDAERRRKVPAFLVVKWEDRIGAIRAQPFFLEKTGVLRRVDRGDPHDVDVSVEINVRHFADPAEMSGWVPIAKAAARRPRDGLSRGPRGNPGLYFFFPAFFWSAALNSFATFWGIPIFFAKPGLWAAAAIVRACFLETLGMGHLLRPEVYAGKQKAPDDLRGPCASRASRGRLAVS